MLAEETAEAFYQQPTTGAGITHPYSCAVLLTLTDGTQWGCHSKTPNKTVSTVHMITKLSRNTPSDMASWTFQNRSAEERAPLKTTSLLEGPLKATVSIFRSRILITFTFGIFIYFCG